MSIKMLYEKDGTTPMGSALNVGYPQTIGGTALTSDVEFTAPSNGWIGVFGTPIGTGEEYTTMRIKIDGTDKFVFQGISRNAGFGAGANFIVPIRQGQKAIATFPTGGGAVFIPDQET